MAENSNNPNVEQNNKGELNRHARASSPSFDPRKNVGRQGQNGSNPAKQAKRKMITEGVKKGAQAFGIPEVATEAFLNTEDGKEAVDAAVDAPTISEGARAAVGVIAKKQFLKKVLPAVIGPFFLILIFAALIFSKDTFGGIGDGTDPYEDLRKEIAKTISNYNGVAEIDGTLILATLVGYNDLEDLEDTSDTGNSVARMKKEVYKLATYQVMTTKACGYDSSTMRKIASNDDTFEEANYNCVVDAEGETHSISIEEGDITDDNSGSVYFWNLIDQDFIFDYYNDYMINRNDNTSENEEKIAEIISEIYGYYETLKEASEGQDYFSTYSTGSGYWWPIGSNETTEENGKLFAKGTPSSINITATFAGDDSVHNGSHGALDISGAKNSANVIATKDGVVLYPYHKSDVQHGDGYLGCTDGGGYGNYVIIDHGDGTYSLYAHMYQDSITVVAGDVVKQGQVIGRVGTSGSSTGPHLHFEIRNGGNSGAFKVDPLLYVDPQNPRPTSSPLKEWLKQIEGGTSGKYVDGDNYVVYDGGDGVLTVGYGIVIVDSGGRQLYTDIYKEKVKVGTRIPKSDVDKMFDMYISGTKSAVSKAMADHNVVLEQHQQDAILSYLYNVGRGHASRVVKAYKDGGNEGFWNAIKDSHSTINGADFHYGLKVRRAEEYELFLKKDYKYDPLSYTEGQPIKYYDVQDW